MTAEQVFGAMVGRDDPLANFKMHAVVALVEGAVEVASEGEALVLIFLEAAEFPDQINFELGADPHAEFKSDIGMGEGAAIASGSGFKADGVGFLNPFLRLEPVGKGDVVAILPGDRSLPKRPQACAIESRSGVHVFSVFFMKTR